MDEGKTDREQPVKEEVIQPKTAVDAEPLSNEEMLTRMHSSTANTINHLDKLIQASSKRSNKRTYLELFRALIEENARHSESLIYLFEYVVDLRASILLLSAEMEKTKGKATKDVKRLKSKLDDLLNSPAVVEIGKILQNMHKVSEKNESREKEEQPLEYLR